MQATIGLTKIVCDICFLYMFVIVMNKISDVGMQSAARGKGWRHAVISGTLDTESVVRAVREHNRSGYSFWITKDYGERPGDEHYHVVYFETSGSSSLRNRLVASDPGCEQKTRQVRCFNCILQYLYSGKHEMVFSHMGSEDHTGRDYCQHGDFTSLNSLSADDDENSVTSESSPVPADEGNNQGDIAETEAYHQKWSQSRSGRYCSAIWKTIQEILPRSINDISNHLYRSGQIEMVIAENFNAVAGKLFDAFRENYLVKSWKDIMNSIPENYFDDKGVYLTIAESLDWFDKIIAFDGFNRTEFIANVYNIMNMVLMKKNCIIFRGPPNSGKTLLANSIVESALFFANVQQMSGKSQFEFQSMLHQRVILVNEPKFSDITIETIKNICEGQNVAIDVKYMSNQVLPRTPLIVTTNAPLCYYTSNRNVNESALLVRSYVYEFQQFTDLRNCIGKLHPLMWKQLIADQ